MKQGIPFVHKVSKRSRSVKIHLDVDGTVVVTTPYGFPRMRIPHYIEEARAWIELRQKENEQKPQLWSDIHVFYFGTRYALRIADQMDGSIVIERDKIVLCPVSPSTQGKTKMLESWLKNRAIEYCVPRIGQLASHMNVSYADVRFKQQKSCWGSCSSDRNLNFNWRLVHAPKEVIDYVIIHELAHLVHMDHSRRFWDLVATFDPDHPLHRGWLKRFGSSAL